MKNLTLVLLILCSCSGGNRERASQEPTTGSEAGTTEETSLPRPIEVTKPSSGDVIRSPLEISGRARGFWFFEASFVVELQDREGNELATAIATAEGEWMTEDFVPFTATLTFEQPEADEGILIFHKQNASGLKEHEDSVEVPVKFN